MCLSVYSMCVCVCTQYICKPMANKLYNVTKTKTISIFVNFSFSSPHRDGMTKHEEEREHDMNNLKINKWKNIPILIDIFRSHPTIKWLLIHTTWSLLHTLQFINSLFIIQRCMPKSRDFFAIICSYDQVINRRKYVGNDVNRMYLFPQWFHCHCPPSPWYRMKFI